MVVLQLAESVRSLLVTIVMGTVNEIETEETRIRSGSGNERKIGNLANGNGIVKEIEARIMIEESEVPSTTIGMKTTKSANVAIPETTDERKRGIKTVIETKTAKDTVQRNTIATGTGIGTSVGGKRMLSKTKKERVQEVITVVIARIGMTYHRSGRGVRQPRRSQRTDVSLTTIISTTALKRQVGIHYALDLLADLLDVTETEIRTR